MNFSSVIVKLSCENAERYFKNDSNHLCLSFDFFVSQAIWRGRKIRRQYSEKIKKSARSSLNYYKKHISHIKLIQRAWRAKKAKIEFRKLLESNNVHR